MTPSLLRSGLFAGAALAVLATVSTASAQQYTSEEAQACTPDAVKFCSDTIPDVGRTAACIRANFAALTPACQTAFTAATGPAAPAVEPAPVAAPEPAAAAPVPAPPPPARMRPARVTPARVTPAQVTPAPVTRAAEAPQAPTPAGFDLFGTNLFGAPAATQPPIAAHGRHASRHHHRVVRESRETRHARSDLARACATGYVSADLCRFTARLITLAQ